MEVRLRHINRGLFEEAYKTALSSTCLKKKVGACLILSITGDTAETGAGQPQVPCEHCSRKERSWTQDGCWSIHAEVRAMVNFWNRFADGFKDGFKMDLNHYVMITTHGPCDQCLKYMAFFGIKVCVYDQEYKTDYKKWNHLISVYKYSDLEEEVRGKKSDLLRL